MQYTSYSPVHCRDGNFNGSVSGFSWTGNERYGDERGYDFRFQPISMDHCRSYNKGMIWWMMQKHEATFRLQVQELHRLYGRQRELMEELKMRQSFWCSRASELSYSSSSQAFSNTNPLVLQEINWLLGLQPRSRFSEPATGNALRSDVKLQELPFSGQYEQRGTHVEERKLVQTADLHKEKVQADICDLNERRTDFPFDLNQPVQIDPPVSSSVVLYDSSESLISEQSRVVNCDDSNLVMDFNLNSVPSSNSSGIETTPALNDSSPVSCHHPPPNLDSKNCHRISGTILEIDLNSTFPADEPSDLADPATDANSMYPISPENQEALPPRCESEDTGRESPFSPIDLDNDLLVARTLVTILNKENGDKCLCWFAEIASTVGDDLGNEEHEPISNRKHKSTGKQVEHKASAGIEKRWKPQGITNSTWKHQQQHYKSWGRTGKREGSCRRRKA